MLVSFHYTPAPPAVTTVHLDMCWGKDGARSANVRIPDDIRAAMAAAGYTDNLALLSLESALALGVLVHLKHGIAVALTGDISVWNDDWGPLSINGNSH